MSRITVLKLVRKNFRFRNTYVDATLKSQIIQPEIKDENKLFVFDTRYRENILDHHRKKLISEITATSRGRMIFCLCSCITKLFDGSQL